MAEDDYVVMAHLKLPVKSLLEFAKLFVRVHRRLLAFRVQRIIRMRPVALRAHRTARTARKQTVHDPCVVRHLIAESPVVDMHPAQPQSPVSSHTVIALMLHISRGKLASDFSHFVQPRHLYTQRPGKGRVPVIICSIHHGMFGVVESIAAMVADVMLLHGRDDVVTAVPAQYACLLPGNEQTPGHSRIAVYATEP